MYVICFSFYHFYICQWDQYGPLHAAHWMPKFGGELWLLALRDKRDRLLGCGLWGPCHQPYPCCLVFWTNVFTKVPCDLGQNTLFSHLFPCVSNKEDACTSLILMRLITIKWQDDCNFAKHKAKCKISYYWLMPIWNKVRCLLYLLHVIYYVQRPIFCLQIYISGCKISLVCR